MRHLAIGIAILAALIAVSFALSFTQYAEYSFFASRYTAVDTKVYHESAAYNEGMIRDLENLKHEYQHADESGRTALRATILHRFAAYDNRALPPDLASFYDSLQR
jgi:hypothetical protein